MLTLEDPIPNREGNPGVFSVSLVGQFKSEVYYDNILVTPNAAGASPTAAADGASAVKVTATIPGSPTTRDASLVEAFQDASGRAAAPTTAPSARGDLNK